MHPPRGWYPDPAHLDLERYWDGHQWTQVVRRMEVVRPKPWAADEVDRPPRPMIDPVKSLPLAGWWRRFGSGVIDTAVAWVLAVVILLVFTPSFLPHLTDLYVSNVREVLNSGIMSISTQLQLAVSMLMMVVGGVTVIYSVVFLGTWGATPGQRACGLKVIKAPPPAALMTHQMAQEFTQEKPGWLRSISKGLGWALFSTGGQLFVVVQLANALLPLWHKRRQSLTDLLANTLMVRDIKPEPTPGRTSETPPAPGR